MKPPLPQVGEPFVLGACECRGSEVLQCTARGVWLRKGEAFAS